MEKKKTEDMTDEELDELMIQQARSQRKPVHRRADGYERKRIYKGAVVKEKNQEKEEGS